MVTVSLKPELLYSHPSRCYLPNNDSVLPALSTTEDAAREGNEVYGVR